MFFCLLLCSCGGASKPIRKTIETAAFALNSADEALKLSFKIHEPEIAETTLKQCLKEGLNRDNCKELYQRNIEKYKYAESAYDPDKGVLTVNFQTKKEITPHSRKLTFYEFSVIVTAGDAVKFYKLPTQTIILKGTMPKLKAKL